MAFTVPARRAEILSTHVAPIAGYLNGDNSTDYEQTVSRFGNSSSTYADQVTQLDTTNGYIARWGYGTRGAQTWVASLTKSGLLAKTVDNFNVRAPVYGATGDGTTDDTAAVQAAVNAAIASLSGGAATSAQVYFPPGTYYLDQINGWNTAGLHLIGAGPYSTYIKPRAGSVHVIDLTGSLQCVIAGLKIGQNDSAVTPKTAIFLNQISAGNSNAIHLQDLYVSGTYSVAALYNYGCPSSSAVNCDFYNYASSANAAVMLFTHDNAAVTAQAPNTGYTGSGATAQATGEQASGDWQFYGCEWHGFNTASSGAAIWLDGVDSVHFYGGNAGCPTAPYIKITDGTSASGRGIHHTFDGLTLYDDGGTNGADAIDLVGGGTFADIVVRNCTMRSTNSMVRLSSGCTVDRLTIENCKQLSSATACVAMASGNATLASPRIDARGQTVSVGAGGTINGGFVYDATITASTNTALTETAAGVVQVRSGTLKVGTTAATTGAIQMSNNTGIYQRNNGDTADVLLLSMDSAQAISIGATSSTSTVTVNSTTGVNLTYGSTTRLATSSAGVTVTGVGTATTAFEAGTTPATSGEFRLPNTGTVQFRNNANNNNIVAVTKDTSDNLTFGNASLASGVNFVAANTLSFLKGATSKIVIGNNVEIGTAALATSATAGHLHIPSCAGTPTGDPSPTAGMIPLIYDSTNQRLYARSGGTWRSVLLA